MLVYKQASEALKDAALPTASRKAAQRDAWVARGFLEFDFSLEALQQVIENQKRAGDLIPVDYTSAILWMSSGEDAISKKLEASKAAMRA